jgi:glycosyltransferase involved in cell wall biosynthesis
MAALAHALPIITTRHFRQMEEGARAAATLPELCDGENCLLVPPDDVKALVRAVQRVADSPDLRARICLGAAALAENFTWDKIVLRHLQLFNRLLV